MILYAAISFFLLGATSAAPSPNGQLEIRQGDPRALRCFEIHTGTIIYWCCQYTSTACTRDGATACKCDSHYWPNCKSINVGTARWEGCGV
ncbi:hypothetical protein B0J12DRAFT_685090 [Macrophomina phaseolina]|uniref:Uncharacterized protein n=1 Tax=Macrophomina phaseolina TaxID=35725 RepID=A0ABQ8FU62_9PEZI|nr:hypothetical protein B0J12DRAFT_685090 [Macrophomina phaseolina]